jgi:hypothetical protein
MTECEAEVWLIFLADYERSSTSHDVSPVNRKLSVC